jgi:hypothetical protein
MTSYSKNICWSLFLLWGSNIFFEEKIMSNLSIQVKSMIGREYDFTVASTDKVGGLKGRLAEKTAIGVDQMRLVYGGKPMLDEKSFGEQNVQPGSVIQLVLQLRG